MFESNYTCHFFRLWGYKEGAKNILLADALLGNMQNDFDAKLGDVAAEIGGRYFIVEFKVEREGFKEEVAPSGKIHRHHLYDHLRNDSRCRAISRQGHFGAYADSLHQLAFEPYVHCVADAKSKTLTVIEQLQNNSGKPHHELDYRSWISNFCGFYESIAEAESEGIAGAGFVDGLGITEGMLEEYVGCMYSHLESIEDDNGEAILGVYSPTAKKFTAFRGSLSELVNRLHLFFAEMKSSHKRIAKKIGP